MGTTVTERTPLGDLLAQRTTEGALGALYEKLPGNKVRCVACGHRCLILDGLVGVCKVRFNVGGTLYVPSGYVGALQCDPIEKKPFFHAYPGALACSFGMLGCDYHCGYCQNWITSQALRDPTAVSPPRDITAEQLVAAAKRLGARVMTSTYNEPLITSEWAVEVFRVARREGLVCSYVSNGNATPEVLDYLRPYVDLYKVDLKGFNDQNYRKLGGLLRTVLDAITMLVAKGFWVEVVTLIVPGFNDGEDELTAIAQFLASVSRDIPWHVTAFHQDYKMLDRDTTPLRSLLRAAELGKKAGLRFVYAGNIPGRVGPFEDTYCPHCNALLIERSGYEILQNSVRDGRCPTCQQAIPGRWYAGENPPQPRGAWMPRAL